MCSHYLVDLVACSPVSGWEKGQVENQVGLVRERFFTPRLRVKSYDELNAWLRDQCVAYAQAHRHPEVRDQTVWNMFEAKRPSLVPYGGRFDGFHAVSASVSKTCPARRSHDTVAELVLLQAEYEAWLGALPDKLHETATAEALQTVCDLDLSELRAIVPPRRHRSSRSRCCSPSLQLQQPS